MDARHSSLGQRKAARCGRIVCRYAGAATDTVLKCQGAAQRYQLLRTVQNGHQIAQGIIKMCRCLLVFVSCHPATDLDGTRIIALAYLGKIDDLAEAVFGATAIETAVGITRHCHHITCKRPFSLTCIIPFGVESVDTQYTESILSY